MLHECVREFRRNVAYFLRFVRERQVLVFITRHGKVVTALIPARSADMDEIERLCRIRRNGRISKDATGPGWEPDVQSHGINRASWMTGLLWGKA